MNAMNTNGNIKGDFLPRLALLFVVINKKLQVIAKILSYLRLFSFISHNNKQ